MIIAWMDYVKYDLGLPYVMSYAVWVPQSQQVRVFWRFGKVYGIRLVVGLLNGLSFGDIIGLSIASLNLIN